MGHGLYTATAGAVARRTQLDLVANNLANAGTAGYRAQKVSFSEVLQDSQSPNRHLVAVGRPMVSWERGPVESTGRSLDLVLQEEGFFVAEGVEGRVLLKTVSARIDSDGTLRDAVGRRILQAGGDERLDGTSPVDVGERGQIIQGGREVGRLLTVDVVDPRGLQPAGNGGYLPTQGSGDLIPVSAPVVSGAIERSNVNSVSSLVRMISVEREYQTLTRVIHAYREADEGIISAASNR